MPQTSPESQSTKTLNFKPKRESAKIDCQVRFKASQCAFPPFLTCRKARHHTKHNPQTVLSRFPSKTNNSSPHGLDHLTQSRHQTPSQPDLRAVL